MPSYHYTTTAKALERPQIARNEMRITFVHNWYIHTKNRNIRFTMLKYCTMVPLEELKTALNTFYIILS